MREKISDHAILHVRNTKLIYEMCCSLEYMKHWTSRMFNIMCYTHKYTVSLANCCCCFCRLLLFILLIFIRNISYFTSPFFHALGLNERHTDIRWITVYAFFVLIFMFRAFAMPLIIYICLIHLMWILGKKDSWALKHVVNALVVYFV